MLQVLQTSQRSSRRTFLSSAALLAGAAALVRPASALATQDDVFTQASSGAYQQGLLTRERFEKLIGTLFMAFLDDGQVAYMRLRSATDFKTRAKHNPITAFHISFDTGGKVIEQASYLLDHGTLGRFVLLLVPGVAADGRPTCGSTIMSFVKS